MRYAGRVLRTPLGIVVVTTIAIATAACTVVCALLDAALFRPPPFRDADRLAVLYITHESPSRGVQRQRWSYRRFLLLRDAVRPLLFSDLASFTRASTLTLTGDGEPEPVEAEVVSTVYFRTLAIRPLFGSTLSTGEADGSLARAEVVVGHDLWRRRFGGERGIVGRRVTINGLPFTVTGVLPAGFAGLTGRAQLWITPGMAAAVTYADYLKTNQNFISVVGRLAPGTTLAAADAALRVIGASIDRAEPSVSETAGDRFAAGALSLNEARIDARERQWVLLAARSGRASLRARLRECYQFTHCARRRTAA